MLSLKAFCLAMNVLISLQTRLFLEHSTLGARSTACAPERQRQSPVVEPSRRCTNWSSRYFASCLPSRRRRKPRSNRSRPRRRSHPGWEFWTKRSKVRTSVGAMRHRYHYDAMHINGKPFVTCNHPAFKFGCAHMTYPRTFMNQHHKLIMGAQIEHKNEPISHVAKDVFLQFAMQQGWSVKRSAYRGKPLGYKGPGMK